MNTTPDATSLRSRYDEVSPQYNKAAPTQLSHKLFWHVYEHLTWSAVEKLLPASGQVWRVLDAGGGGGKYGTRFAERGHHVTVLDLSPGMLERARGEFSSKGLLEQATFVEGNITALAFPEASFDLVFCEGDPVSYCVDEYPRAISELVRVVKPRGPVVMGLDNRFDSFQSALKFGRKHEALSILLNGKARCPYGLPIHTFTLPELHRAVAAAGAEVEEIFGKPVMFFEMLEAFQVARGPSFDPWEARQEILELQERLAHEGYAVTGVHLQVMARRK